MKLNKTRERVIELVKASLENGVIPWQQKWTYESVHNASTNSKYKGVNNLVLQLVSLERNIIDPRWMTFKQAIKKGYKFKSSAKGSGVPIEFWSFYNTKTRKNISIKEAKELVASDKANEKILKPVARTYYVFSAVDIDGIEEYQVSNINTAEVEQSLAYKVLHKYITTENINLTHMNGLGACYIPNSNCINIPSIELFKDKYSYLSVLAHECAHSTCSSTSLKRSIDTDKRKKEYAQEELIAEVSAAFLCNDLNLEMIHEDEKQHQAYLQTWLSLLEDKPQELFKVINNSQKVSDYILYAGEYSKCLEKQLLQEECDYDNCLELS